MTPSIRARTLNVTWTECPRHRWPPYAKALYVGDFRDGDFHGQGTYIWVNGNVYIGRWRDGKMHGWGTLTFPNGDKYEGIWSNDKLMYGDVYTDGQNCALRLSRNYYLPAKDACRKN